MLRETFHDTFDRRTESRPNKPSDQSFLGDLLEVLEAHPRGLRRWSVMRAMRVRAEKANREVTPKFEDEVERIFRRHCEGDSVRLGREDIWDELFHRPKETAGEVWALHPNRTNLAKP